jgi:hypothetical protein
VVVDVVGRRPQTIHRRKAMPDSNLRRLPVLVSRQYFNGDTSRYPLPREEHIMRYDGRVSCHRFWKQ